MIELYEALQKLLNHISGRSGDVPYSTVSAGYRTLAYAEKDVRAEYMQKIKSYLAAGLDDTVDLSPLESRPMPAVQRSLRFAETFAESIADYRRAARGPAALEAITRSNSAMAMLLEEING